MHSNPALSYMFLSVAFLILVFASFFLGLEVQKRFTKRWILEQVTGGDAKVVEMGADDDPRTNVIMISEASPFARHLPNGVLWSRSVEFLSEGEAGDE